MKQLFLKTVIMLIITLSFTNCDKEEVNQLTTNEIEKIKSDFSLENFENLIIKNNLSIDWNNYVQQKDDENKAIIYEFNTSYNSNNFVENNK